MERIAMGFGEWDLCSMWDILEKLKLGAKFLTENLKAIYSHRILILEYTWNSKERILSGLCPFQIQTLTLCPNHLPSNVASYNRRKLRSFIPLC